MTNKIISLLLTGSLLSTMGATASAKEYPDVEKTEDYATAVETLTKLNVIDGDENGLFNPDKLVTRAEFTKMLVSALGEIDAAKAQTSAFKDTTNHWAAGFIAQGVSGEWINGYDKDTFGPEDNVTFEQACKMIMASLHYNSYADQKGGYPMGYVTLAHEEEVTKGVSARDSQKLTRAEVAKMIYNALDTPLVDFDFDVTWNGSLARTPKKMDGTNGNDYNTLLTEKHNAYVVKGRVVVTSKDSTTNLKNDEVKYQVEAADNFDDIQNIRKGEDTYTFKIGDTAAASMLFEYSEAIVQKDEDSDEFTIVSISTYGKSKTLTIANDDVAEDYDYTSNGKLPVYKSESTTSTYNYSLAPNAKIYVNGIDAGTITNDKIQKYIIDNKTGSTMIVDATETGSTSTDGKYDYLMVNYYVDAIVDSVTETDEYVKISFKDNLSAPANKIQWQKDDDDVNITITDTTGKSISYKDIKEYDVTSIAYNVVDNDSFVDIENCEIIVSDNTVTGTVTNKDDVDWTITVDKTKYDVIRIKDINDFNLSTDYTFYLNAFGDIVYVDEVASSRNYGIIVAMYTESGEDTPTVKMINSEGQEVKYVCKDIAEATKFYNYAMTGDATATTAPTAFTKTDNKTRIIAGSTACTYKMSNGKIRFDKPLVAFGGTDLMYKESTSKLGGYTLTTATKLINIEEYINSSNSSTAVSTIDISDFEDENIYTAYMYDKNSNGEYRFGIVLEGTNALKKDSVVSVVQKRVGTTTKNDTTVTEYKVARANNTDVSVYFEGEDVKLAEGSVIAYKNGIDGYVESGNVYTIFTPAATYTDFYNDFVNKTNTTATLTAFGNCAAATSLGDKYADAVTPTYGSASNKDVVMYAGIVYKKNNNNLEIITNTENNKSNVNDIKSFDVSTANSYVYNYKNKDKNRVDAEAISQSTSIFNVAYENDKNDINWTTAATEDVTPAFAVIKVVDNDVIDVVYYINE